MRIWLVASTLVVAMASPAAAAEVSLKDVAGGGKALVYSAAPGEINNLSINLQGSEYTVQDIAGSPLTAQAPCTAWSDPMLQGTGAKCPATDVNGIQVALGDQTDQASVGGISNVLVPVAIDSGPGPDRIFSGSGLDTISVFNGVSGDDVTCNAGEDTVYADPGDTVAADCEHVLLEAPAAAVAPLAVADPSAELGPPAELAPPDPFRARARVNGSTVRYGCSARCTVRGVLLLRRRKVGSAGPVKLPHGGAIRVRYKLSRAGKRALAAHGRLRLRLMTTFTANSGITELNTPVVLVRPRRTPV